MLTLQGLKKIADMREDGERLPTAKQLRSTGVVIVREQLGQGAEITAYRNGCALYRVGSHSTVFPFHPCMDYSYLSDGRAVHLPGQFFEHERWYLRLVLEGEDRLERNHTEKERRWNISYSTISEEWDAMVDRAGSAVERLVRQETLEEIFKMLTKRQRYIVYRYYLQEETQKQISHELSISQQAVSKAISQAVQNIRKNYQDLLDPLIRRICYGEGRA